MNGAAGAEATRSKTAHRRRIGPWQLMAPLGSGQAGIIHRAEHETSGVTAALKTLRDARARQLGLIRREIFALSELDHPGIVAVLDHGVHQGVPWYAMEYLPHPTLREWFENHADPARWRARVQLCVRVLRTLAYLHSRGLVHGDIKPDNIIVRPDLQTVLVDFGLAVRFRQHDERACIDPYTPQGSPAYVAPEQLAGHGADHRSDLYSMGCVLFEACTGTRPFAGSLSEVLRAQRELSLPDPRRLNPDVPDALATLLAEVTTKDQLRRLHTAGDLADQLDRLLDGLHDRLNDRLHDGPRDGRPDAAGDGAPGPLRYVHRPVLRGRAAETGRLADFMSGADAAHALLLRGGSGVGKSFLVAECCRSLPPDVLQHSYSCRPEDAARAEGRFAPLRSLLEQMIDSCVELGADFTAELFGADARLLALLEPRLRELPGAAQDAMEVAQARGLDERFVTAFRSVLGRWCARRPLLLIIDDAQWLDDETRFVLDRLSPRWCREAQLRILLIACDDLGGRVPDLSGLAPSTMNLEALEREQLRALVLDLLGTGSIDETPFEPVLDAALGNPLYVAEYVRAAVAAGSVRIGQAIADVDADAIATLPMPGNARDIVRARLQRLSAAARVLLGTTVALERLATLARLEIICGGADDILRTVSSLIEAGFLVEAADGTLSLQHHQHARVVADDWPEEHRHAVHRRVADCLEAELDAELDGDGASLRQLGTIARCRQRSNDENAEFEARIRAGRAARQAFDFASSVEHLQRARDLAVGRAPAEARARIDMDLAESLAALGSTAEAVRLANVALAAIGYRLPAASGSWTGYLLRRVLARPIAGYRRGHRQPRERLRTAYRGLRLLSQEFFFHDNLPGGLAVNLLTLDLADANPGSRPPLRTYSTVGGFAEAIGLRQTASKLYKTGLALLAEEQSGEEIVAFWLSLSLMTANQGRWDEAMGAAARAEAALEDVWDPQQRDLSRVLRGHIEYYRGELSTSEQTYSALHARALADDNIQLLAWSEFSMARALHGLGDHARAVELLESAEARMTPATELQSRIITAGLLAAARMALGETTGALEAADRGATLIEEAVPTGFPTVEGFGGVLEVYARHPDRRRQALRLLRRFRRFTRTTPCALPRYRYCDGLLETAEKPARARRTLESGMKLALAMGMALDASRCAGALLDLDPGRADAAALRATAAREGIPQQRG